MRETFAGRIRKVAREHAPGTTFTAPQMMEWVGIGERSERTKVRMAIRDFVKRGEMEKVGDGVFRYLSKRSKASKLTCQQVMWRFLRMRKTVTRDDLVEVSGADPDYALEWLNSMNRMGVIRKIRDEDGARYQLIKDSVEVPRDGSKPEYLRALRRRKREALMSLARAKEAVNDAICALNHMEDPEMGASDLHVIQEKPNEEGENQ